MAASRLRTLRGAAAALVLGCSGPPPEPTTLYDGAPTDEALAQMLALPTAEGAALTILSPASGDDIRVETPLTLSFAEGTAQLLPAHPDGGEESPHRAFHADHWFLRVAVPFGSCLAVTAAHAHGTPYSGVAYLLEFTDQQGQLRLRVFTDQTTFTIPEAEWSSLASSPGPITLTIDSATFEDNGVVSDGGPFERARVAFSIE